MCPPVCCSCGWGHYASGTPLPQKWYVPEPLPERVLFCAHRDQRVRGIMAKLAVSGTPSTNPKSGTAGIQRICGFIDGGIIVTFNKFPLNGHKSPPYLHADGRSWPDDGITPTYRPLTCAVQTEVLISGNPDNRQVANPDIGSPSFSASGQRLSDCLSATTTWTSFCFVVYPDAPEPGDNKVSCNQATTSATTVARTNADHIAPPHQIIYLSCST